MSYEAGSGNRWESGASPSDSSQPPFTDHTTVPVQDVGPSDQATPGSSVARSSRRDQGIWAGLAALFLVGGGAGGYAVGHGVAADADVVQPGQPAGQRPAPGDLGRGDRT